MKGIKLPSPRGEGQIRSSHTTSMKSGEVNLYLQRRIARLNKIARNRQIQDAIYNALACVATSYLSLLFAYWLFSFPTLYLEFGNNTTKGFSHHCSQVRSFT